MRRRINRPEQLRLELQWPYLNWLVNEAEQLEFFEKTAKALVEDQIVMANPPLLWKELDLRSKNVS